MATKPKRSPKGKKQPPENGLVTRPNGAQAPAPKRNAQGQWLKGYSGSTQTDAARARRTLNAATIQGMQWAFDKYGRGAIEKVAKTQPAIFLKMLVLLVPRELEITQARGPGGMSDEALEAAVTAIEGFLARRAGDGAKVINATASEYLSDTNP